METPINYRRPSNRPSVSAKTEKDGVGGGEGAHGRMGVLLYILCSVLLVSLTIL